MDKVMKQIMFPREGVICAILRYNHDRKHLETLSYPQLVYIKESSHLVKPSTSQREEVIDDILKENYERAHLERLSDSDLAEIKRKLNYR